MSLMRKEALQTLQRLDGEIADISQDNFGTLPSSSSHLIGMQGIIAALLEVASAIRDTQDPVESAGTIQDESTASPVSSSPFG